MVKNSSSSQGSRSCELPCPPSCGQQLKEGLAWSGSSPHCEPSNAQESPDSHQFAERHAVRRSFRQSGRPQPSSPYLSCCAQQTLLADCALQSQNRLTSLCYPCRRQGRDCARRMSALKNYQVAGLC